MSRTIAGWRALASVIMAAIILQQGVLAQQSQPQGGSRVETDPGIQDLLGIRKAEHWGFLETQLLPTAPPRSQPVRAIPEWYPAGGVMLTLDSDYVESFELNKLLRTEGKGDEILAQDPKAMAYVRAVMCNTLNSAKSFAAEPLQHDPDAADNIKTVCKNQPTGEANTPVLSVEDPEEASLLAYSLLKYSSEDVLLNHLSFAHTFIRVVGEMSKHTRVLILVPSVGMTEDSLYDEVSRIKLFPTGGELLKSKNVQFVQVLVKTKWVRDYGPIFMRNANGQIFCVDTRYQTDRESLAEKRQFERLKRALQGAVIEGAKEYLGSKQADDDKDTEEEKSSRLLDDVSPSLLVARLRQKNGELLLPYPVTAVRPPMALDGGDFFTDGEGVGFTSTETLQLNGGNVELLNILFKEYFGLKNVVYLHPLPGSTVKHIDMFFKVVSPDIILLGKFDSGGHDRFVTPIQTEAQRVLAYNLSILKNFYESRGQKVNVIADDAAQIPKEKDVINIVLVPMPDLSRPIREKLARIDDEVAKLTKELKQHKNVLEDAESQRDDLEFWPEILGGVADSAKEAAAELQTPGATEANLSQLREDIEELVSIIKDLDKEYGENTKRLGWQGISDRLARLEQTLAAKGISTGGDLTPEDRRTLARQIDDAASGIKAVVSDLQSIKKKIDDDYEQHSQEQARALAEYLRLIEQRAKLQERYPYGSDIYRTFLNALQIKTGPENLLLVPAYKGLDDLEKRAQDIFRKAYTRAYGSVTIIPVDSDYMIQLSGSIHCLTQTIPAELDILTDDWNFRARVGEQ